MNFFRRNFGIKIFTLLSGVGLSLGLVLIFLRIRYELQFLTLEFVAYGIVFFVLLAYFVFWFSVSRPLREIIHEMEALLTGREYKKFFSKRIDEIGVMAHFFNEITRKLHTFAGSVSEGQNMANELEVAARIQKNILPSRPSTVPGLVVSAMSRPAARVGGDSFDFIENDGKLYFYIGDATGHGVPAGLIMTMVNALVRAFVRVSSSLVTILADVNRVLKSRIEKTLFMSLVLLRFDSSSGSLSFAGAGHEHILFYRAATGQCDIIPAGGIALGMIPEIGTLVKEQVVDFAEGDMLFLYTDGITEARNSQGELYGLERLKVAISKFASQYPPQPTLTKIAADVGSFVAGVQQTDDMTLIAVQRTSASSDASQFQFSTDWRET